MRHGKRVRRRSRRRGWGLLLGALLLILGLVACTRAALRPDTPAPVPAPEHSEAPEHTAPAASAPPEAARVNAPVRQNVVSRREVFIVIIIFLFIGYPPNPDAYGRDV